MATADQYAEWIVANQSKKGTPEFNTVAEAYKVAKSEPMPAMPASQPDAPIDPTEDMSFGQNALAGIGKSFVDTGRGIKQFGADIGNKVGLVSDQTVQNIQDDVNANAQLDAPLMNTAGGITGNIIGQTAQFAAPASIVGKVPMVANAARSTIGKFLLSASGGAILGSTQPVATENTRLGQSAMGAAGGLVGQGVASAVPKIASSASGKSVANATAKNAQNAQKFAIAKEANQLGYVIPPADLNPSAVSELASGLSGKIKTAQTASQRNQIVTNELAKKALGLTENDTLDVQTLDAIRKQAGDAYEVVRGVGIVQPSASYEKALTNAAKPFNDSVKSFPNRALPAVVKDIESLKTNQFDAGDAVETIKILRDEADKAYRAGDKTVGKAYRQSAEALEGAIDEHLVKTQASKDILDNYRNARKTIAKTYTVENALNNTTGNVDANKIAKLVDKRKPLDNELLQIGKFASAFPKAAQALKETPKATSPLDWATGGLASAGSGSFAPMALIAGRPAVRSVLLSKVAQNKAVNNSAYKPSTLATLSKKATNNQLFESGAVPIGVALGLQGAP